MIGHSERVEDLNEQSSFFWRYPLLSPRRCAGGKDHFDHTNTAGELAEYLRVNRGDPHATKRTGCPVFAQGPSRGVRHAADKPFCFPRLNHRGQRTCNIFRGLVGAQPELARWPQQSGWVVRFPESDAILADRQPPRGTKPDIPAPESAK